MERAKGVAAEIENAGGVALPLPADVLDSEQLEGARETALGRWSRVDILVNAAGGNVQAAAVAEDAEVFGVPEEALRRAMDLNLMGTVLPCQVFGEAMARAGAGSIVNVSSMAA